MTQENYLNLKKVKVNSDKKLRGKRQKSLLEK